MKRKRLFGIIIIFALAVVSYFLLDKTKAAETITNASSINFSKSSYTCSVGESFDTLITAEDLSGSTILTVKSFSSNDTSTVAVEESDEQPKCINCRSIKVTCKKLGVASIIAVASDGTRATASVTVTQSSVGTISFSKSSYTCKAGETFTTLLTAYSGSSGTVSRIKSYSSSNTNIATIDDKVQEQTNCINCRNLRVTCKKAGTVTLNAESTTGAKGSASVTVTQNSVGTINLEKSSYTCNVGEVFETLVRAESGSDGNIASIKSFSSSNPDIVMVDDNASEQPKCINCRNLRVTCKKSGTATINVESSLGAKNSASVNVTINAIPAATYTITANSNGGKIVSTFDDWTVSNNKTATKKVREGAPCGELPTVVKSGYRFKEWNTKADGKGTTVTSKTIVNSNMTIYAIYSVQPNQHQISIHFDSDSYSCKAGESFYGYLITDVDSIIDMINISPNYNSSNTNVATINSNESNSFDPCQSVNLISKAGTQCHAFVVSCKSAGTATLNVVYGSASDTSKLTVSSKPQTTTYTVTAKALAGDFSNGVSAGWTTSKDNTIAIKKVNANSVIGDLPTPYSNSKGHKFKEWNTSSDGKGTVITSKSIVKSNMTIYAIYQAITYDNKVAIYFEKDSYSCNSGNELYTYAISSSSNPDFSISTVPYYSSSNVSVATIEISTNSTNNKCKNLKLTDGSDCQTLKIVCKQSGTATLTAKYGSATDTAKLSVGATLTQYTITADAGKNGGYIDSASSGWVVSSNNLTATKKVNNGESYGSLPTASSNSKGHKFKEWNTSSDGKGTVITSNSIVNSNITIYAIYELITYNISSVNFEKEKYYCNPGETINTYVITDSEDYLILGKPKFNSSNTSMATIESNTSSNNPCNNVKLVNQVGVKCYGVKVNCKSSGAVTLSATYGTSSNTAKLIVYYHGTHITTDTTEVNTIVLNANGGTITETPSSWTTRNNTTSTKSIESGSALGSIPVVSKEGSVLKEWNTKPDGSGTSVTSASSTTINVDTVLYAQWEQTSNDTTKKISFDCNGGTGAMQSLNANFGDSVSLPRNACSNGSFAFAYWQPYVGNEPIADELYKNKDNADYKFDSDITLKAEWTTLDNMYYVKYNPNNGNGIMVDTQAVVDVSEALNKNEFKYANHIFDGWKAFYTDSNGVLTALKENGQDRVFKDQDSFKNLYGPNGEMVTLYAQWIAQSGIQNSKYFMPILTGIVVIIGLLVCVLLVKKNNN